MLNTRFDPQLFFQSAQNVALHVAASELFGLFRRSLDLPSAWGAMVSRRGGEREVFRSGVLDGNDAEDVLFARTTPIELSWERDGFSSRDGLSCKAHVRLRVSLIPERGELQSFVKNVLGSRRVAQAEGLVKYLEPTLAAALAKFASENEAAKLTDPVSSNLAITQMAEALRAPCFAAGLSLESEPVIRFESDSLREVQRSKDEAVRRRVEHEAALDLRKVIAHAHAEHLDHLTSVLQRLNELTASSPNVSLPELVRTFSEHQRGQLYEALFSTEPTAHLTHWIVVAAGDELFFFDPRDPRSPQRRFLLKGSAGPMRSVQAGHPASGNGSGATTLLLGASTGIYRLPLNRTEPDRQWVVPNTPAVRGGFNAVVAVGDRIFGSHSELGVWTWNADESEPGHQMIESLTQGAKAVRHIQSFDGFLFCSVDQRVARWSGEPGSGVAEIRQYLGSLSPITALCVTTEGVFAGNSDGDLLHWPHDNFNAPRRLHTGNGRPVESVSVQSFHGVPRVVFTDTSPYVHARVLGDNFATRFEAGGQTLRRADVAPDWIVGTNEIRDRLFCWPAGKPDAPSVINIGALCGRSVQDVCLIAEEVLK